MIRHIVMWNLKDELSKEEKSKSALKIKEDLEGLKGVISGVIEIKVVINPLDSSNVDIMLDSLFESEEALKAYQVHPEHQKVASFAKTVVDGRYCIDYLD